MKLPGMREMGEGFGERLLASGFVHLCVLGLLIFGLPWFIRAPVEHKTISVEIVGGVGSPPPSDRPIPTPPKADTPTPPKPKPTPPKPKPTPPKPEVKPEVKPEPALVPKPVQDKVPPPPKPQTKPPPKPDPKETPKPNTDEEFGSILKNLANDAAPGTKDSTGNNPLAREKMDDGEMSALQSQLGQCWNIVAGAREAETLAVEIELTINADRTVANAVVVDSVRYNTDPAFRAAADSAKRAVRHPLCTPLDLPPEKYDAWKNIVFEFDPRGML